MVTRRNIFLIGRRRDDEDQLTEMLVWLAETVPNVRAALVRLALGRDDIDASEIVVGTQHGIVGGRLDALLTGPDFAVVIESKLGSSYGAGQIRRYLEWLASDAVHARDRGLMTLTAEHAPWCPEDRLFAQKAAIAPSEQRWEDLHELLEPVTTADEMRYEVASQIVQEFLEMLSEERLVPLKPLGADDFGPAWSTAWDVVTRYRDFFRAAKTPIAEALGAQAVSNRRSSERGDWFWQDFSFEDGVQLAVGLSMTSGYERVSPSHAKAPIVWLAPSAEHVDDWLARAAWMDANPPDEWRRGNRWYDRRPLCWRYLADVIGAGIADEQQRRLADAACDGRKWVDDAIAR